MLNKCFVSKGKLLGFSFQRLNEDPIREMTICHTPQREEIDPGILSFHRNPTPVTQCFKEFYFTFYFI